jgi:cell division protein FtsA
MVDAGDAIEVPGVGGRTPRSIPRQYLVSIIEPRMEEIFQLVGKVLSDSGYLELLGAGVVLCGGATLLEGTTELAEQVLRLPIRRGQPMGVGGMAEMVRSPALATAVGLLKYGALRSTRSLNTPLLTKGFQSGAQPGAAATEADGPALGKRVLGWLKEVF